MMKHPLRHRGDSRGEWAG